MKTTVNTENGRVWIDGASGFGPGDYASSPHGCQARILEAVGESVGYDDLLVYSAFAFRIGVHEAMCPSAAHPCCGYMCMKGSNHALPWRVKLFQRLPWEAPKADPEAFKQDARAAIRASIDRGIPVHYGSEEDGLIIGYGDQGRRWWCLHPYHQSGSEAFWHDEADGFAGGSWPWGIVIWTEPQPADQRAAHQDLTRAALEQAVDMWNTEQTDVYFGGDAAYAHWLDWLHGVDGGTIDDPLPGMQGNGWYFDVLIHSRRIAGRWLTQTVGTFDAHTAAELRVAAHHYTRIADYCMRDLPSAWDLAPGPGRAGDWTRAMREEQIKRLEAARIRDRAAIESITRALDHLP